MVKEKTDKICKQKEQATKEINDSGRKELQKNLVIWSLSS